MTGKVARLSSQLTFALLVLGFLFVPLAETSEGMKVQARATLPPLPQPIGGGPVFPRTPVDISEFVGTPFQLTRGGCCSYPGWSSDSEWILYLDGYSGDIEPGLYHIPRIGGKPSLLTTSFGSFSNDWTLVAYPEGDQVIVERWADGSRWSVPSSGRAVVFSHDNRHIAWEIGPQHIQSPDRRLSQVWVSEVSGNAARELVTIHGGQFVDWLGSDAILVTGRLSPPDPAGIWRIDRVTGAGQLLFEIERPRDILISPGGEWLAFVVAFENETNRNGIWVVKTDGSHVERLTVFGSYRWRSEGQLMIMPLDLNQKYPDLYQLDLIDGMVWKLIDAQETALTITNNDWTVSPNGQWLLYHSSEDRNLWMLEIPEPNDPA